MRKMLFGLEALTGRDLGGKMKTLIKILTVLSDVNFSFSYPLFLISYPLLFIEIII